MTVNIKAVNELTGETVAEISIPYTVGGFDPDTQEWVSGVNAKAAEEGITLRWRVSTDFAEEGSEDDLHSGNCIHAVRRVLPDRSRRHKASAGTDPGNSRQDEGTMTELPDISRLPKKWQSHILNLERKVQELTAYIEELSAPAPDSRVFIKTHGTPDRPVSNGVDPFTFQLGSSHFDYVQARIDTSRVRAGGKIEDGPSFLYLTSGGAQLVIAPNASNSVSVYLAED